MMEGNFKLGSLSQEGNRMTWHLRETSLKCAFYLRFIRLFEHTYFPVKSLQAKK